jgi:molecular chaperone GrpE (heat shock protein)
MMDSSKMPDWADIEPIHSGAEDDVKEKRVGPAPAEDVQIHRRLVHLETQSGHIQAQMEQLLAETQVGSSQIEALVRHLTDFQAGQDLTERVAELVSRLEAVQEEMGSLNSTVTRLGRSQFKSNTLVESKEQQIEQALGTLQEIATRREQISDARVAAERERTERLRAEARGELATALLPGLDGLELALENGHGLLASQRRRAEAQQTANWSERMEKPGVLQKLRRAWAAPAAPEPHPPSPPHDDVADALAGWLEGVALVQERFLALLAQEGIRPIEALMQPFDPRLHVAVETEIRNDVAPNTVVAVGRKGYVQGSHVLRYSEVVVSRSDTDSGEEPIQI